MRKSSNSLLSVTLSSNSPIDSTLPGWNPLSTEYNGSSYIPHGLRRHGGRFWASCEKAPERNIVTPPPGKRADFPAATIEPSTLVAEREPVQVLLSIRGDVGNYVQGVRSQPSPQGIGLPPVIDGSVSVAGGDSIKRGWSVDFYGASDIRVRYGHGVGWKDQEDEFMTEGWPRKYVCCVCSLKWKATPIPGTLFLEQDRKALRIPVPLDTQKDPGFTRPQASELYYYLAHKTTPADFCVRGLCQTCIPASSLPSSHCCPPSETDKSRPKEIYRCIMDNYARPPALADSMLDPSDLFEHPESQDFPRPPEPSSTKADEKLEFTILGYCFGKAEEGLREVLETTGLLKNPLNGGHYLLLKDEP
ncbi:hypothetical protein CCUS01_11230 [Colletotrichum cuscutae]|uniref:Uncharacterized protein n=1 Tax=Colletotrichum cuscutae TaxID=1209917 RepID=A0AAI9U600_9PEZI|nr:hypothetical protein CCUS01_11230 [Colletotrichum cuscutae]